VRFLGLRQDIPRILAVLHAFVLPSLSEGLSMAILEAMVAGKPVIATDVGGNPELVEDSETGYLVPSQNSQALADRLISLLMNRDRALQFGKVGQLRAQGQFSLRTMVREYQAIYDQCIEARR